MGFVKSKSGLAILREPPQPRLSLPSAQLRTLDSTGSAKRLCPNTKDEFSRAKRPTGPQARSHTHGLRRHFRPERFTLSRGFRGRVR